MVIKLIFFLIGAIVGSFLNSAIYRLPRRKSLLFPGSYCPQCGHKIHYWDNVPLLSYLVLKGKCRHCRKNIPVRYLLVELLTASLFTVFYILYGLSYEFLFYITLLIVLIIVTFTDLETKRVLNIVVFTGAVLAFYMSLIFWPLNFIYSLIGFLTGGGVLIFWAVIGKLLFKKESLGYGDIKLAAMIGIFLGLQNTLLALFLSFSLATLIGIFMIMLKKARMDSKIPFAPFLALGSLLSLIWSDELFSLYWKIIG
ncbi:MAG: prepilin peptidase [Candidatus Marinimicrobia bacterium]|nr:prepilin peptidase [Candidatus Neomarinimicrobiota bacterium]